jgi:hypothetical protein
MSWSVVRPALLGAAALLVLEVLALGLGKDRLVNAFSRLSGYRVERGTLVTRRRFALLQDGRPVGTLDAGARLELIGNTDKMTRFHLELAWPEGSPRAEAFAQAAPGEGTFVELGPVP